MALEFVEKLKQEIKALEYELHNELPREIQRARELGDLSENAEYSAAKERQSLVNAPVSSPHSSADASPSQSSRERSWRASARIAGRWPGAPAT